MTIEQPTIKSCEDRITDYLLEGCIDNIPLHIDVLSAFFQHSDRTKEYASGLAHTRTEDIRESIVLKLLEEAKKLARNGIDDGENQPAYEAKLSQASNVAFAEIRGHNAEYSYEWLNYAGEKIGEMYIAKKKEEFVHASK